MCLVSAKLKRDSWRVGSLSRGGGGGKTKHSPPSKVQVMDVFSLTATPTYAPNRVHKANYIRILIVKIFQTYRRKTQRASRTRTGLGGAKKRETLNTDYFHVNTKIFHLVVTGIIYLPSTQISQHVLQPTSAVHLMAIPSDKLERFQG